MCTCCRWRPEEGVRSPGAEGIVIDAGNFTWVLCNSSKSPYPLSQLSSPRMETFYCNISTSVPALLLEASADSRGPLSEHSPRMESCENSRNTRQEKVLWLQFLQRHGIVLGMFFQASGVADKNAFTSDCSLQLAVVIWLYASMGGKTYFAMCSLSLWLYTAWTLENFSQKTFLSPLGKNCLTLWIKLAITWDFSPPHF